MEETTVTLRFKKVEVELKRLDRTKNADLLKLPETYIVRDRKGQAWWFNNEGSAKTVYAALNEGREVKWENKEVGISE